MFFRCDHHARLARRAHDRLRIDGLERVQIHDARLQAELLLQNPCRAHGLGHHRSAGDDAQILSFVGAILGEARLEGIDKVSISPRAG